MTNSPQDDERRPFDPKTTTFTNLALDEIMPVVSGSAWKVLCLAIRKIEGWADLSTYSRRKESDLISISQFQKGTGIKSENTIRDAIEECLQAGYLLREPDGQTFRYRLDMGYILPDTPSIFEGVLPQKLRGSEAKTPSKIEDTNTKEFNTKKNTKSIAPLGAAPLLTKGGLAYFTAWQRKRWANEAQRKAFEAVEAEVGSETMVAAVQWAANAGISDVNRIIKAARGWGKPKANGARTAGRAAPVGGGRTRGTEHYGDDPAKLAAMRASIDEHEWDWLDKKAEVG